MRQLPRLLARFILPLSLLTLLVILVVLRQHQRRDFDGIRVVTPIGMMTFVAQPPSGETCMGSPRPGFLHLLTTMRPSSVSQCGVARVTRSQEHSFWLCSSKTMHSIQRSPIPTVLNQHEIHVLYGYPQAISLTALAMCGLFFQTIRRRKRN